MSYSTPSDRRDYERFSRLDYSQDYIGCSEWRREVRLDVFMEQEGEQMNTWIGVKVGDLARYIDPLNSQADVYVRVGTELRKVKQVEVRPLEDSPDRKPGFSVMIPDEMIVLVGGE